MCKGCHGHIVGHVEGLGIGKAAGCVCLTFILECLGHFAEVSVENTFETRLPRGGELAVGLGDHSLEVGSDGSVQLAVHVLFFAVVEAGVHLFGHGAIALPHIGHVGNGAACGKVRLAVHTHELLCFFFVAEAHGVHLRNVEAVTTLAHNLVLEV